MKTELLVGSYINRRTNDKIRVVRIDGTRTFRGYVNGTLAIEGTRNAAMKLAH